MSLGKTIKQLDTYGKSNPYEKGTLGYFMWELNHPTNPYPKGTKEYEVWKSQHNIK